jgi:cell filamentation protein
MLPLSGYCRASLRRYTPCIAVNDIDVARALAEVHAELILVHPFRDGNVRLARLLALLMALQAGLPPLDFSPLAGRGKRAYIVSIHAAMNHHYAPLTTNFERVIGRSRRRAASKAR